MCGPECYTDNRVSAGSFHLRGTFLSWAFATLLLLVVCSPILKCIDSCWLVQSARSLQPWYGESRSIRSQRPMLGCKQLSHLKKMQIANLTISLSAKARLPCWTIPPSTILIPEILQSPYRPLLEEAPAARCSLQLVNEHVS